MAHLRNLRHQSTSGMLLVNIVHVALVSPDEMVAQHLEGLGERMADHPNTYSKHICKTNRSKSEKNEIGIPFPIKSMNYYVQQSY
jgi:hypothetical protein